MFEFLDKKATFHTSEKTNDKQRQNKTRFWLDIDKIHFKLNVKVVPEYEAYFSFLIKELTIVSDFLRRLRR